MTPGVNYSKCCCCSIKAGTITVAILEFLGILITLITISIMYKNGGAGEVSKSTSTGSAIQSPNFVAANSLKTVADKKVQLGGNTGSLIGTLIGFLVGTAAIIVLLIGVIKERPKFVFIHLIVQGLAILGLLIGIIVYGLIASDHTQMTNQDWTPDRYVAYKNDQEIQGATPSPELMEDFKDRIKVTRHAIAIAFCVMMGLGVGVQMIFTFVVFKCFRYLSNKGS